MILGILVDITLKITNISSETFYAGQRKKRWLFDVFERL